MDKLKRQGELYIKENGYAFRVWGNSIIGYFELSFELSDDEIKTLTLPDFGKIVKDEDIVFNFKKYINSAFVLDPNIFDYRRINKTIYIPDARPIEIIASNRWNVKSPFLKMVLPKSMDLFTFAYTWRNDDGELKYDSRAVIASKKLHELENQTFKTFEENRTFEIKPGKYGSLPELDRISFAHYDENENIILDEDENHL